jgi:hypothetical protein
MTKKYEIIPPSRGGLPTVRNEDRGVTVTPLRINPGGIIESTLTRWEANRHGRTIGAIAARTRAESDLFDAQTQALASYCKRQEAAFRLQELPEVLANDLARRRVERSEELRRVQHQHDLAETRRMTELAQAQVILVDAQQALAAQRDHGYTTYELGWKKKQCEMLDVELNAAERRAILRQHLAELERQDASERRDNSDSRGSDDDIDDALYEARAQLNANGLDSSRIDAAIDRRKVSRTPGSGGGDHE